MSEIKNAMSSHIFKRNHIREQEKEKNSHQKVDLKQENKNMIIQAFELGFLKSRKRYLMNNQLKEIKQQDAREKAIKDVLEFTMKQGKNQIIEDLKKIDNIVVEQDFKSSKRIQMMENSSTSSLGKQSGCLYLCNFKPNILNFKQYRRFKCGYPFRLT